MVPSDWQQRQQRQQRQRQSEDVGFCRDGSNIAATAAAASASEKVAVVVVGRRLSRSEEARLSLGELRERDVRLHTLFTLPFSIDISLFF